MKNNIESTPVEDSSKNLTSIASLKDTAIAFANIVGASNKPKEIVTQTDKLLI